MSACQTLPVTVTVWPTCFDSFTVLVFSSQVLPSSALKSYSPALSPADKQPVSVRTLSLLSCAAFPPARLKLGTMAMLDSARKLSANLLFIELPPFLFAAGRMGKTAQLQR